MPHMYSAVPTTSTSLWFTVFISEQRALFSTALSSGMYNYVGVCPLHLLSTCTCMQHLPLIGATQYTPAANLACTTNAGGQFRIDKVIMVADNVQQLLDASLALCLLVHT